MSNRKEEILEKSIELFNEKGCINSSTRHIADALGISVGNLYYYFKNKEEIIIAIYMKFMNILSEQLSTVKKGVDAPFDFYNFLNEHMELEKKYRFFRLEMNSILQNHPVLKKSLEEGIKKKSQEFKELYYHQINFGYMISLDEDEMDFIRSNTWIIGSQWELYWILMEVYDEKLRRLSGILNLLYFLKPYLTKKGLEESNLLSSIAHIKEEIKNAK
ncbi:TetR/AcrR family transcriptional regulator [Arcobacter sp. LA11]|uniref:TetR/AcrR family transcriptional regulator n=1 Tax=Arcobacter sp. LA11 TaxID=1898176 RepID=UPI000932AA39|nr:TetR/AcrR family transcriptional regulator [Arcobacter sp. LA11]